MGPHIVEPEFSFRGRMNSFVFGKGVMGIAGESCKISVPEVFSAPLPTIPALASCAKRICG